MILLIMGLGVLISYTTDRITRIPSAKALVEAAAGARKINGTAAVSSKVFFSTPPCTGVTNVPKIWSIEVPKATRKAFKTT